MHVSKLIRMTPSGALVQEERQRKPSCVPPRDSRYADWVEHHPNQIGNISHQTQWNNRLLGITPREEVETKHISLSLLLLLLDYLMSTQPVLLFFLFL